MLLALLLSACLVRPTPQATPTTIRPLVIKAEENPYAPKPEEINLQQTGVILTSLDLADLSDATPLRTQLTILGSMPSVCKELRIEVSPPDDAYQILIKIYSVVNPKITCDNVFQQFETSILLGVYSPGRYIVIVNSEFVEDFIVY
mgnify:CR=1 FL=1